MPSLQSYHTVQDLYIAYYQRPGDPSGLLFWSQYLEAPGATLEQVEAAFGNSEESTKLYGPINSETIGTVIDQMYLAMFNRLPDEAGKQFYIDGFNAGTFTATSIAYNILVGATGVDAVNIQNKQTVANDFSQTVAGVPYSDPAFGIGTSFAATYSGEADAVSARSMLHGVTELPTTILSHSQVVSYIQTNIADPGDPILTQGATFPLTTGVDTVVGTVGDDTINGNVSDTWSAFDNVDGAAGTDTMNVLTSAATSPGAVTVKNVENLNVNTTAAGYTINTTGFTGLTKLSVADSVAGTVAVTAAATTEVNASATVGAGAVTVVGSGGALTVAAGTGAVNVGQTAVANAITSASVTGGSTVNIQDRSGTAAATGTKLTTVSLNGNTGAAVLTADGLTSLSVAKQVTNTQTTTVTAAAGTRALALALNGVDSSADGAATAAETITFADATATSVAVNSTGAASFDVTVAAAAAKAVTIAADVGLQMDALTAGNATAVGISGASKVTITADTLAAAAVITSTNTGGVTLTQALLAGQQFIGGAGTDSITVANTTTVADNTGAGNDTVALAAGFAAFGTGGSVDAGDGTDTLKGDAADLAAVSGAATFETKISNFEAVSVNAMAANTTIDIANLDDINTVTHAGGAFTLTLNNMATGASITQTAGATGTTVGPTAAFTAGTADVLNFTVKGAAVVAAGTLTATAIETVNLTSTDTNTTPAGTLVHTLTLTDAGVTTVTVAGNAGLTLTAADTTITSLNASAMTVDAQAAGADGKGLTWTSGALAAAATVTGSAGVDVINMTAATKAVTLNGGAGGKAGSGGDLLTGGAGDDTITFSGLGNASLSGLAGKDAITGGSGDDTITGGAGLDTLTGGAGKDDFVYTAASQSQGTTVDVITDFSAGTSTSVVDQLSITVANPGSATYLGEANGYGAVLTSLVNDGNGHAVLDTSTSTLYVDANGDGVLDTNDYAIQLTGVVDLHSGNFIWT